MKRFEGSRLSGLACMRMLAGSAILLLVSGLLALVGTVAAQGSVPPTLGDCDPITYPHSRSTGAVTACIGGVEFNSRLKKLKDQASSTLPCLTGTVVEGQDYPSNSACGGTGPEQIAQARLINRAGDSNDTVRSLFGLTWDAQSHLGGIDPGIQWETSLPGQTRKFPDFLAFDPRDPESVVYVAEVKQKTNRDRKVVYEQQLRKYVSSLEDKLGEGRAQMLNVEGYSDSFSVCGQEYSVSAEDVSGSYDSDYDPVEHPDDKNALLYVTRVSSSPPVSKQTLDSDGGPIDCPVRWSEDGDGDSGADYDSDPPAPDFSGIDDAMDALQCAIDVFEGQAIKLVKYIPISGNRYRIGGAIVKEVDDQAENPIADRCPPPGGGWGDPHLTSLDGLSFDVQSAGEFDLMHAEAIDLTLQARFQPWNVNRDASVMTDIAFTLNGFMVEMGQGGALRVNGDPYTLTNSELLYFNNGSLIGRVGAKYVVIAPGVGNEGVVLTWVGNTLRVVASPGLETSGLLGDHDGDPRDDLTTRDGETTNNVTSGFLHGRFAESWRISQQDSLFTYGPGQSTETYTDREFPQGAVTLADFPADEVEDAFATCEDVDEGSARDGCALDFLLTGSTQFLDEALAATSAPVSAMPIELDETGPAVVDFNTTVPLNFAPHRRMNIADLGSLAGPFPSGAQYEFDLPVAANHSGIQAKVDLVVSGAMTVSRSRTLDVRLGQAFSDTIAFSRSGAVADSGTVTQLGSGTAADGTPWVRYRYTTTLPASAVTLTGEVTANGWSRYQSDRVGIAQIEFDLADKAPASWRELALNETVWPDPTATGANGIISERGERERYRFTLDAPTRVGLDYADGRGLQYFCGFAILIQRSTGKRMPSCFDALEPEEGGDGYPAILPAGEYELRVAASEDAYLPFKYGVTLYTPATAESFDAVIDEDPVVFEPDVATGAGILPSIFGDDVYELDVRQSGTLIAEVECVMPATDCAPYRNLVVHSQDGDEQVQVVGRGAFDVSPGNYALKMTAAAGHREYKLTLRVVPRQIEAIALGEIIKPGTGGMGVLTEAAPVDRFSFEIPTGGAMTYLDRLQRYPTYDEKSGKLTCTFWLLRDENGNDLDPCMFYGAWLEGGEYSVTVRAPWRADLPFEYGFGFYTDQEVTDQEFDLTPSGDPQLSATSPLHVVSDSVTGRGYLDNYRSVDTYRFTASEVGTPKVMVSCAPGEPAKPLAQAGCVYRAVSLVDDWRSGPAVPGREFELQISNVWHGSIAYALDVSLTPAYNYSVGQVIATNSHGAGSGTLTESARSDLFRLDVAEDGTTSWVSSTIRTGVWTSRSTRLPPAKRCRPTSTQAPRRSWWQAATSSRSRRGRLKTIRTSQRLLIACA